jgi:hypothetical protein
LAQLSTFSGGSGTQADPYQIATPADLWDLRDYVGWDYEDVYFKIMNDIDLNVSPYYSGWTPIGNWDEPFYGHIIAPTSDAKPYMKILNLYINNPTVPPDSNEGIGLFGWFAGTIENVGIENCNIIANSWVYVGGLIGVAYAPYEGYAITHCYASGSVKGQSRVGGLVGINSDYVLKNCYSSCLVESNEDGYVGGLVGTNNGVIDGCYATGNVVANDYGYVAGGLVGMNNDGAASEFVPLYGVRIRNSYAIGNVTATNMVGGLVGENSAYVTATDSIYNCYATGIVNATVAVSGNSYAGGIVGGSENNITNNIYNCFAANASISNITAGQAHRIYGSDNITAGNNYALNTMLVNGVAKTNTNSNNSEGASKTIAELTTQPFYAGMGWNFANIWIFHTPNSLPTLQWQYANTQYTVSLQITPTAATNGETGAEASGAGQVTYGQTAYFSVTNNSTCYSFENWQDTIGNVIATTPNANIVVTSDTVLVAHFIQKTVTIQTSLDPNNIGATLSPSANAAYLCGEVIQIEAFAPECHYFYRWVVISSGQTFGYDNPMELTINDNLNIKATFFPITYSVAVQSDPVGIGNPTVAAPVVLCGNNTTISAGSAACYQFVNWTDLAGNFIATDINSTINVKSDTTLVAHYIPVQKTLTLNVYPPGAGSVNGGGIVDCGVETTIYAFPIDCSSFEYWADAAGNIISYSPIENVIIYSDTVIYAHFTQNPSLSIIVTVNPAGSGIVSHPNSIGCGENATFSASASDCYHFLNYTDLAGNILSSQNVATLLITRDTNIIANFVQDEFTVRFIAVPEVGGTINETQQVLCNDTLNLLANSASCYTFVNWSDSATGAIISTDSSYQIVISRDMTIIGTFALNAYNVSVSVEPPNSGYASGTGVYYCDEVATFVATPSDCYGFVNWKDGITGEILSTSPIYSHIITSDMVVIAEFATQLFPIRVMTTPDNLGEVSGGGEYLCGTEITISATPYSCYRFMNWTDSLTGVIISTLANYTFTVTDSITLIAHFVKDSVEISVTCEPEGVANMSSTGKIVCNTDGVISAVPGNCFTFICWTDAVTGDTLPYQAVDTVKNVTENRSYIAHFKRDSINVIFVSEPPEGGDVLTASGMWICGLSLPLNAVANDCYHFKGWYNMVTNDTIYRNAFDTLTVDGDMVIKAIFERDSFNLVLLMEPDNMGIVNGGGRVACGETIQIQAINLPCNRFIKWIDIASGEEWITPNVNIQLTSDRTLLAYFARDSFDLVLQSNDNSIGLVYGGGVKECGTTVLINAIAGDCSSFVNWTDGVTGTVVSTDANYIISSIESDMFLIGNFKSDSMVVVATSSNAGMGSVSGGGTYSCGSNVILVATTSGCHSFVNWQDDSGNVVSTEPTLEINDIHNDSNVVAYFKLDSVRLTLRTNNDLMGTTSPSMILGCGASVTIIATPSDCHSFINWTDSLTGAVVSTNSQYTIISITQDMTLIANYKHDSMLVMATVGELGFGIVTGSRMYACGETATLTAVSAGCHSFVNWTDAAGNVLSTDAIIIIENVHNDTALVAHFKLDTFQLVLLANDATMGTVTPSQMVICGDSVIINATPIHCHSFENWTDISGNVVSTSQIYMVKDIISDMTLIANFKADSLYVMLSSNSNGGIVSNSGLYGCGDSVEIIASALKCYHFVAWWNMTTNEQFSTNATEKFVLSENTILQAMFEQDSIEVVLRAEPSEGGVARGGGHYICGAEVTITAYERDCYHFAYWLDEVKGDTIHDNPYTFETGSDDKSYIAYFARDSFFLTLQTEPSYAGIANVVGGFNHYDCGELAVIEAADDDCWIFVNWTTVNGKLVSTNKSDTVRMGSDTTLIAHFVERTKYITLIAEPADGGDVRLYGGVAEDKLVLEQHCGDNVTIEALPESGYHFLYWRNVNNGLMYDAVANINVTSDSLLYAVFEKDIIPIVDSFRVLLMKNPTNGGIVQMNGEDTSDMIFADGLDVTISAKPLGDYEFMNWTLLSPYPVGKVISISQDTTLKMYRDYVIYANFRDTSARSMYDVFLYSDPYGVGKLEGEGRYKMYDSVTIKYTPDECYTFDYWTNGKDTIRKPEFTTMILDADLIYVAHCTEKVFSINVNSVPPYMGHITGNTTGSYNCNYPGYLTAIPENESLFGFVHWVITSAEKIDTVKDNPLHKVFDANYTIVAEFAKKVSIIDDLNGIKVYPNPAQDRLYISYNFDAQVQMNITLTDVLGNTRLVVFDGMADSGSINLQVDISELPNGVYFLHFASEQSRIVKKIIIMK